MNTKENLQNTKFIILLVLVFVAFVEIFMVYNIYHCTKRIGWEEDIKSGSEAMMQVNDGSTHAADISSIDSANEQIKKYKSARLKYILGAAVCTIIGVCAVLALLIGKKNTLERAMVNNPSDNADAIRKYKALYDDGIISKEEFEKKKEQLLL